MKEHGEKTLSLYEAYCTIPMALCVHCSASRDSLNPTVCLSHCSTEDFTSHSQAFKAFCSVMASDVSDDLSIKVKCAPVICRKWPDSEALLLG